MRSVKYSRTFRVSAVFLGSLSIIPHEVNGQDPCVLFTRVDSPEFDPDDDFGFQAVLQNDLAIISASAASLDSLGGAVYVFRNDGPDWVLEQKLRPQESKTSDGFGGDLAIEGDLLVISATGTVLDSETVGAAYVFRFDGSAWEQEALLSAFDGISGDSFGSAVAINGDRVLVGASGHDAAGADVGAAYVYRYDGFEWVLEQKLVPGPDPRSIYFGNAVALSEDLVVVAAPEDHQFGPQSGAVYAYRHDGTEWKPDPKIVVLNGFRNDYFGGSVAIHQERLMISAFSANITGDDSGAVYVFEFDGIAWVESGKVLGADTRANDYFGDPFSVQGNMATITSYQDSNAYGIFEGAAYFFSWNGAEWQQQQKMLCPEGDITDYFGLSAAVNDDIGLISAILDDDTSSGPSAVYLINGLSRDCNGNAIDDICDLNSGVSLDLNFNSLPDECDPNSCVGDVNIDGGVDPLDSGFILARLGCPVGNGSADCDAADVNGDGFVDPLDVGSVLSRLQECPSCPQESRFFTENGQSFDSFGGSVSMHGNVAVVGAKGNGSPDENPGAMYIFRREGMTWTQEAKLATSDSVPGDNFGHDVSVWGEVAVGTNYTAAVRSAYVFRFDGLTWTEEQKLEPWDTSEINDFGRSVAVGNDFIAVGDFRDDGLSEDAGAVYVYAYEDGQWSPFQLLYPSVDEFEPFFGYDVALREDVMLVGAKEAGPVNAGAADVYRFNGAEWTFEQRLEADDGQLYEEFGTAVALYDRIAVVGTSVADAPENESGAVYVYRFDGVQWFQEQKLVPNPTDDMEHFGTSVAVYGDNLVVGAVDGNDSYPGTAYRFHYDGATWTQVEQLFPSEDFGCCDYGESVAMFGDTAIVGAPAEYDDFTFKLTGVVYAEIGMNNDCNGNLVADACDIDRGDSPDADADRLPDECN